MRFIASISPPTRMENIQSEKSSGRLIVIYWNGSRELYKQATVLSYSRDSICIEYFGHYIGLKGVKNWSVERT